MAEKSEIERQKEEAEKLIRGNGYGECLIALGTLAMEVPNLSAKDAFGLLSAAAKRMGYLE